jgi:hypothetical protein
VKPVEDRMIATPPLAHVAAFSKSPASSALESHPNVEKHDVRMGHTHMWRLTSRTGEAHGLFAPTVGAGYSGSLSFVAVAVVEGRSSDAHGYVGGAPANMSGTDQGTLAADDIGHALVVDGVAQKIGRWIQLSKAGLGALQLLLHGGEQDVALFIRGQDCP